MLQLTSPPLSINILYNLVGSTHFHYKPNVERPGAGELTLAKLMIDAAALKTHYRLKSA